MRARQRGLRPHPRVDQAQASDARVLRAVTQVQQGRAGAVAQAPQDHLLYGWGSQQQGLHGGGDVGADVFESTRVARAVTHAAAVKPKHRMAFGGGTPGQLHKLPVAAGAVLRAAHDDQNAHFVWCFGQAGHAHQALPQAAEVERVFGVLHAGTRA